MQYITLTLNWNNSDFAACVMWLMVRMFPHFLLVFWQGNCRGISWVHFGHPSADSQGLWDCSCLHPLDPIHRSYVLFFITGIPPPTRIAFKVLQRAGALWCNHRFKQMPGSIAITRYLEPTAKIGWSVWTMGAHREHLHKATLTREKVLSAN